MITALDFNHVYQDFITPVSTTPSKPAIAPMRGQVRDGYKTTVNHFALFHISGNSIECQVYGNHCGDITATISKNAKGQPQLALTALGNLSVSQAEKLIYKAFADMAKKVRKPAGLFNSKNLKGFYVQKRKPGAKSKTIAKALSKGIISPSFKAALFRWNFTLAEF